MARDFTPNDFLTVTDASDLRFTTAMSASVWAYFDSVAAHKTIFQKGLNASTMDYCLNIGLVSAGFSMWDGTAWRGGTASTLSTGVWTHCGVTWDGSNFRFYVNGSAAGVVAGTTIPTSTNNLRIGQQGPTASNNLDGRLADFALWNVALTAEEIAGLAKAYSPLLIRPASRKLYCDLVRDFFDWHGHACTVSSGTTVVPHCRVIRPKSRRGA